MTNFINTVSEYINKNELLKKNQKVLIAVSGGADSISLLHLFNNTLQKDFKLKIYVAHLNHMLRGKESDSDEEFVKNICDKWNIELFCKKIDIKKTIKKGDSLENHARNVRYNFLHNIKEKAKADVIVTGHNKNDQIETILMRIIKGTGLRGLCGISPKRADSVIRPLLNTRRRDIEEYLNYHNVPHITDNSNSDNRFLRNDIRNKILPTLTNMDNTVEDDLIYIQQKAYLYWTKLSKKVTKESQKKIILTDKREFILNLDAPLKYPSYVIYDFLKHFTERPSRKNIKDVLKLIKSNHGKFIKAGNGYNVIRTNNELRAYKNNNKKYNSVYTCMQGEKIILEEIGVTLTSYLKNKKPSVFPKDSAKEAYFDADKIGNTWQIRYWEYGDTFYPLGLKGKKKVSDLLCERKIYANQKRETIIMKTSKEIFWVVGHRIGEKFKIDNNTKRYLHIVINQGE